MRFCVAAVVSVTLVFSSVAYAGPPFETDDAELPDPGEWEFTVPFTFERDDQGDVSGSFIDLDINYGINRTSQYSIEIPWNFDHPPGGPTVAGVGDTALEYKWSPQSGQSHMLAVNVELTIPTGDEARGLGSGQAYGELSLLYEITGGGSTWMNDVTWAPKQGNDAESEWFVGSAYLHDVGGGLELGGEAYYTSPDEPGADGTVTVALGGIWDYTDNREFMFSVGRGLDGDPDYTGFIGINFTGVTFGGSN